MEVHFICHLILSIMLYITNCTHLRGKKTKAEENQVTHPSPHCYKPKDPHCYPRLSPKAVILSTLPCHLPRKILTRLMRRKGAEKKIKSKVTG